MVLEKLLNPKHDFDGFKFPSIANSTSKKIDKELNRFMILAILKHAPRGLLAGYLTWTMFGDPYARPIEWAEAGLILDLTQYSLRYVNAIYQKNYTED